MRRRRTAGRPGGRGGPCLLHRHFVQHDSPRVCKLRGWCVNGESKVQHYVELRWSSTWERCKLRGWCVDGESEVQHLRYGGHQLDQGGENDSDGKWSCRFCQQETFKVVQNGHRASGNQTNGLPDMAETDD